jgi:hypothetical protein
MLTREELRSPDPADSLQLEALVWPDVQAPVDVPTVDPDCRSRVLRSDRPIRRYAQAVKEMGVRSPEQPPEASAATLSQRWGGKPLQIEMERTGIEPVTSGLQSWGGRSHPFAPVRSTRLVTGVALRRTEPVRTGTNARCYHCSH